MIERIQEADKELRCWYAVPRAKGWCCDFTERPSGRIKECPVEYGDKCPMEENSGA